MGYENFTVLIVDDEPDICFLLAGMLRQKKLIPVIANTLNEGMNKLRQERPVLLFMDIHLPDGSGLDAIRGVKKEFPLMKIIIMSAFDGMIEKNKAYEAGADVFISKPLNHELIVNSVMKVMDLH